MVKCEVCSKEVDVSPYREYIYVLLQTGKPSTEKPFFFHMDCFLRILKKNSELYNQVLVWETISKVVG